MYNYHMKLSVIVPVYNEERTVREILDKILSVSVDKEIIIVDDGSTDKTRERLIDYSDKIGKAGQIRIVTHDKNLGKGSAVRTAIEFIQGDLAIIQDADLEYEPVEYTRLIDAIKYENAGLVYGSRFLGKKHVTSRFHRFANWVLTFLTNILYGSNLTDMPTCYKLFKAELLKNLKLKSNGFTIDAEITAKLLKKGVKIPEVPISYRGRSYHEGKKITWKDGFAIMATLIKYRFLP